MNNRIKQIRNSQGLTQIQFGERIGVKGNTITNYENNMRTPSEAVILSICREFNVNETWLRTGKGKMFITKTRAEEIEGFVKEVLQEDSDFRRRVISVLARMTPDEWELVERKAREIFEETKNTSQTPVQDAEEAYIKNFGSAKREESTASSSTSDTPNDAGGMVG